jgi:hypothetical protein
MQEVNPDRRSIVVGLSSRDALRPIAAVPEGNMKRMHLALLLGALCLGLATTTTVVAAAAAQPSPPTIEDQNDRLLRHLQIEQATREQAAADLARSMERNDAAVSTAPSPPGAQPVEPTETTVPRPGIDLFATLLLGLVGGLVGGCAAMAGWTATTRRRVRRAASTA